MTPATVSVSVCEGGLSVSSIAPRREGQGGRFDAKAGDIATDPENPLNFSSSERILAETL